jgi:hypothetical protein
LGEGGVIERHGAGGDGERTGDDLLLEIGDDGINGALRKNIRACLVRAGLGNLAGGNRTGEKGDDDPGQYHHEGEHNDERDAPLARNAEMRGETWATHGAVNCDSN